MEQHLLYTISKKKKNLQNNMFTRSDGFKVKTP